MKVNSLFKTLLLATSICALTMTVTQQAHAQMNTLTSTNSGWDWSGYYYSFWTSAPGPTFNYGSGSGNGNNYSVSWNNFSGDFTSGVGWSQGWWGHTIGYNCGYYSQSGGGCFGIYGWTESPLVEYYVVEMSAGQGPGGSYVGSYSSDGANYNIYYHRQINQPSILGHNADFDQFISVRQGNASQGTNHTVTCANHFQAWANHGMALGSKWDSQILLTEGWNGSGSVNATVW